MEKEVKEKMYNVSFEINIYAESPLDAAKQAQQLLNEENDWQFYAQDSETKEIFSVDLQEEDEDAVSTIDKKEYKPIIER